MQGFAERKKEEQKLLEAEKKKPATHPVNANTMSEGPMLLKESLSVEQQGRASFEKSVKIELAAMKKLRDRKKKGKRRGKRKARAGRKSGKRKSRD